MVHRLLECSLVGVTTGAADRCSAFARGQSLDPVGTAGGYDGLVLAEWPLPWPQRVTEIAELATLLARVEEAAGPAGRGRLQTLVPAGDGGRGVVTYQRPGGPFAGYRLLEATVAEGGPARCVLICTHGARDRCCGSMGTALFQRFAELEPDVRLWRTSHTSGHRFAPTALVLPEGTAWAYLEPETLAGIVHRDVPVELARAHYRGCFGLDAPEVQAVDREALLHHGWGWLDTPRAGEVVTRDGRRTVVRLEGGGVVHEAEVELTRMVPVPDCGKPIELARKAQPEWRVVSFSPGSAGPG